MTTAGVYFLAGLLLAGVILGVGALLLVHYWRRFTSEARFGWTFALALAAGLTVVAWPGTVVAFTIFMIGLKLRKPK